MSTPAENPLITMARQLQLIAPALPALAEQAETVLADMRRDGIKPGGHELIAVLGLIAHVLANFHAATSAGIPRFVEAVTSMRALAEAN